MNLADRINSFEMIGNILIRYHENSEEANLLPVINAARTASATNPWFTPELIRVALNNLGKALHGDNLHLWLSAYESRIEHGLQQRSIGVVMAGNIPVVGFHDFLCVLISGHKLVAKLSSSDEHLLPAIAKIMVDVTPEWKEYISFTTGRLEKFDAIIATGSTNTSRYFEFYFGRYPHIIRRSRNSVAIINGRESSQTLDDITDDIMLFFGMGCRSISKIFVPSGYDFSPLIRALGKFGHYANHHKYRNNYDYSKSIFLVNQVQFIDTGFLLLQENLDISSRIALLHYEYYTNPEAVISSIQKNVEKVQCVVSDIKLPIKSLRPGESQNPTLWDYADNIDTMEFLLSQN